MLADCRQLISPTLKGLPDLLNSHPRTAPTVRVVTVVEVGDEANFVRNSRNGQIWSVKHELLRFAVQILSLTFNSLPDC